MRKSRFKTDVVTIIFRRNRHGVRVITSFRVIGTAFPCRRFLFIGGRVSAAQRCLLNNGFRLIFHSGNVLVFKRRRKHG